MKTVKLGFIIIGALVLFAGCEPKEDLSGIRQELTNFQSEWLKTGNAIRQTLDSLKKDNQALHDLLVNMNKVKDSSTKLSSKSKASLDSLFISVNHLKDSLSVELKNFNGLTQNWNQQKANLNQLNDNIQSNTITHEQARKQLDDLQNFQQEAVGELEDLQQVRNVYAEHFISYNARFKTDFPRR